MHRVLFLLFVLFGLVACSGAPPNGGNPAVPPSTDGRGAILLNGERMDVRWSDGDSFKFKSGQFEGSGVRLTGFNTLESYGPVHRWGTWTGAELYAIARTSKDVAAAGLWTCSTSGEKDGYGRLLVDCPDAAEALIRVGHAHAFSMDGPSDRRLLAAQRKAQRRGLGIWKKGAPALIVTSLHSQEEGSGYNRRVDSVTGMSSVRNHEETYQMCQEVCEGPEGQQSCLVYVPYSRRYRNKPDCLK